jgi:hypothetical protein
MLKFKNEESKKKFENDKFSQILLKNAKVTKYINNDYGTVPEIYQYKNVTIEYIMHWGFYKINNKSISMLPDSIKELDYDIERLLRK